MGTKSGESLRPGDRRPLYLALVLLAYLVGAVFWPILGYEFVDLDVTHEVIANPYIKSLSWQNIRHILTQPCMTSYYPARTLSYALNHQIWGLNPGGYKLTNGLIHLANVYLLLWLLLRLARSRSGGTTDDGKPWWDTVAVTVAAGIFAVHPLVVEPVVWTCGREELLMTLFTLACFHAHLTARQFGPDRPGRIQPIAYHALAACFCLLASWSNAVAVVIPALVTVWDWIALERPKLRRIAAGTAALWAIAVVTVLVKRASEGSDVTGIPSPFSWDGVKVILNVYWLDLKVLVWPTGLTLHHEWPFPRGSRPIEAILGALAVLATIIVLWSVRRQKQPLFGLLWFLIALAPTLHFFVHHIFRAERYLYLPLIGIAIAAAAFLRAVGRRLSRPRLQLLVAAGGLLVVALLNLRSMQQVRTWENSITAWSHCLAVYPDSVKAHAALGRNLNNAGRLHEAAFHLRTALELDPRDTESVVFLITILTEGPEDLRDYDLAVQLADRNLEVIDQLDPIDGHALSIVYNNYALQAADRGQFERAVEYYAKAIAVDPRFSAPLFNLALLRATCEDQQWQDLDEAVRLAERACAVSPQADPNGLMILAMAYDRAGRTEEAVETATSALELAESAGNRALAEQIRGEIERYRSGGER